jgi:hypothetical protein
MHGEETLTWLKDEILLRSIREGRRASTTKEYRIALGYLIETFDLIIFLI